MSGVSSETENAGQVRANRTLRRTREQLISTSGTRPTFDHDMTRHYALNRIRAGVALPALTLITAAISWYFYKQDFIIVWFVVTLGLQIGILYLSYHFLNKVKDFKQSKKWPAYFTAAEILHGISWSTLLYFIGSSNNFLII